MNLLLDTHAFVWWILDSPKLPVFWRKAISSGSNRVAVSSASILKMAIKIAQGKLRLAKDIDMAIENIPAACGFEDLFITSKHAAFVGKLPMLHRDPFDRILVAQAMIEKKTLVSLDKNISAYQVQLLVPEAT